MLLPDASGRLQTSQGAGTGGVARRRRPVGRAVGLRSRPAGGARHRHAARRARAVPAAQRARSRRSACSPCGPPSAAACCCPEQRHLLETFAGQIALAIERAQLAEEAEAARVAAETESLRNTLLASISHDLRTPLAVITGRAARSTTRTLRPDAEARAQLARSIDAKAREMSELISNVLDLMRFEAGEVHLRRDWQTVDDLSAAALARLEGRFGGRSGRCGPARRLAAGLRRCAAHHAGAGQPARKRDQAHAAGTRITVRPDPRARRCGSRSTTTGPGLPAGEPEQLFAKFQRGREESNVGGAGLGLAICRAIVNAHGGHIAAMQRPGGGARFEFTLPTAAPSP